MLSVPRANSILLLRSTRTSLCLSLCQVLAESSSHLCHYWTLLAVVFATFLDARRPLTSHLRYSTSIPSPLLACERTLDHNTTCPAPHPRVYGITILPTCDRTVAADRTLPTSLFLPIANSCRDYYFRPRTRRRPSLPRCGPTLPSPRATPPTAFLLRF
ncbi:hypothetical protein GGR56DRAFT_504034 [Xylariaceae sp. FL0804]|nr:hypothetical protein GGR56DRAFT_504034 [Xylariaceae sp. FL0804]